MTSDARDALSGDGIRICPTCEEAPRTLRGALRTELLGQTLAENVQLTRERESLVEALRLTCENYPPCEECGAPAAEWWLWNTRLPEGDDMTPLCESCVGESKGDCAPAEPMDHIAAIAKVRHLLPLLRVGEANDPESPEGSP